MVQHTFLSSFFRGTQRVLLLQVDRMYNNTHLMTHKNKAGACALRSVLAAVTTQLLNHHYRLNDERFSRPFRISVLRLSLFLEAIIKSLSSKIKWFVKDWHSDGFSSLWSELTAYGSDYAETIKSYQCPTMQHLHKLFVVHHQIVYTVQKITEILALCR